MLLKSGPVTVKHLKEEGCMAPDFIWESVEETSLHIQNPDQAFPVEVTLRSLTEYNRILAKHVHSVCADCIRFRDDADPSLNGHHREISLDGSCYSKERLTDPLKFSYMADSVFMEIAKNKKKIEKAVQKGDHKKLTKLIGKYFRYVFPEPVRFFGSFSGEKYTVCMDATADYLRGNILRFLCSIVNGSNGKLPLFGENWEFVPYLRQGDFCYDPKFFGMDFDKNPIRYTMQWEETVDEDGEVDRQLSKIHVVLPAAARKSKKRQEKYFEAAYFYLCAQIGEDAVNRIEEYDQTEDDGEPTYGIGEVRSAIDELREGSDRPFYPNVLDAARSDDNIDHPVLLPYKESCRFLSSACPDIAFRLMYESPNDENMRFEYLGLRYAYIFVPETGEEAQAFKLNMLSELFANYSQYPEPIFSKAEPLNSIVLGYGVGEEGVFLDFLVGDEGGFFQTVRTLAPALSAWNAKLVLVRKDGNRSYRCGYILTPEHSGTVN